jgi:hypothetical protein
MRERLGTSGAEKLSPRRTQALVRGPSTSPLGAM